MPEMEKGNPDAAQDEGLIQSVIERDLGPIFEAIGSRLKDLEEDLGEAKDLLFKFAEGLMGAADNHKRTRLSEEISGKYGKDLEPFEGFHKDAYGKGLSESLIEELMGEGAPGDEERDGWIKGKLGELKGKFGKYVGIKEEAPGEPPKEAAKVEMGAVPEPGAESAKEEIAGEPEAKAEEKESEEGGEAGGDTIDQMMSELKSLGGARRKLSEPVMAGAKGKR
jgi:hypothetical protein